MMQIPELFEDIRIPSYITENYGNVDVDVSVYFGPSGTISPLHFDPKHNLLAQVKVIDIHLNVFLLTTVNIFLCISRTSKGIILLPVN